MLITDIPEKVIVLNTEGDTAIADIIIENLQGTWYGVSDGQDWEYLQDNGDYIPVID